MLNTSNLLNDIQLRSIIVILKVIKFLSDNTSIITMSTYKDWIVEHPKKGKIKLGKLSHNELCRFVFDLYIMNQEMSKKLKEFINLFDNLEK